MMNIKTLLSEASSLLKSDEAAIEAQLLLQHLLNVNRAWLIAHANDALQPSIHAGFQALIERRLNGEPIAYILGYREFYGLKLTVTPDTLIPRPDTETLVEAALAKIPQNDTTSFPSFPRRRESMLNLDQKMDSRLRGYDEISHISEHSPPLRILDLGTGTGAVALAIAKNRPAANVTAVDFSEGALNVAMSNARELNITNVTFIKSDWLSALGAQTFDLIVSNPPYIEQTDTHLQQGDLRFEPLSALASGADGLDDIRTIIQQAKTHLRPHGWLMLEHGYNQADRVSHLLKTAGFSEVCHALDLAGIQRVTLGCLA